MKPFFALSSLFALTLMLCGCPSNVSQTKLQKAATASEQAMVVVEGFQQGEILTYNQGKTCITSAMTETAKAACIVIPDEDHLFIQQSVMALFRADKTINTCILNAANSVAASACANEGIDLVSRLESDGTLHLKSPTAKQDFAITMLGVKSTLIVISTIMGGS